MSEELRCFFEHSKWSSGIIGNASRAQVLLSIYLLSLSSRGHYAGPTEDELYKKSGLERDNFFATLDALLQDRMIVHALVQEGTAGPYAHRYNIAFQKLSVKLFTDAPSS